MSADCPNCSKNDQVKSSQTIYAEQTGTSHFTGTMAGAAWAGGLVPVVAGTQTSGSHSSILGRRVAPPTPPTPRSAMSGGLVALTVIGAVIAFIAIVVLHSVHTAYAQGQVTGFLVLGLLMAGISIVSAIVRSPGLRRVYAENVARWRAYSYVWQNALICLRCYVAFFPGDIFSPGTAPDSLIPVDHFHAAVTDIGNRLYQADRAAFQAPPPN